MNQSKNKNQEPEKQVSNDEAILFQFVFSKYQELLPQDRSSDQPRTSEWNLTIYSTINKLIIGVNMSIFYTPWFFLNAKSHLFQMATHNHRSYPQRLIEQNMYEM